MMDEKDNMVSLVHPEAREDFLAARRRLREIRMRQIDEHECPQAMDVRDAAGNAVVTPFSVGRATYDEDYDKAAAGHKEGKKGFIPDMPSAEHDAVVEQLAEVSKQYNQFSGITTRDGDGNEVSFSAKSDHPPIKEGESHEEWFARVSGAYSKTAAVATKAGSSRADIDGIRRSSGDDSSDGRQASSDSAAVRGDAAPADMDCISQPDVSIGRKSGDDAGYDSIQRKPSGTDGTAEDAGSTVSSDSPDE